MREINRLRIHHVPVPVQVAVHLFLRHHQKILVRQFPRRLEVILLLRQPLRSRIARVRIVVEVAEVNHVDPQPAEHRNPRRLEVRRPPVPHHLVQLQVEVPGHRLEPRHRLVGVVVRVLQHRLIGRMAPGCAQVVVHRHMLHRSGRRVVQRIIQHLLPRDSLAPIPHLVRHAPRLVSLALLRLHHAQRKLARRILAVVHITEIDLVLARKEKLVRRRKNPQRPCARLQNLQPVSRLHIHRPLIHIAAEILLLPHLRRVPPNHLAIVLDGKALQPRLVDEGHVLRVRARHRLLPQQVRALVRRKLQVARKQPQRQPVERHRHPVPIRLHLARIGFVTHRGTFYLVLRACRPYQVARVESRDLQRRIPEHVPLVALLVLRRVLVQPHQDFLLRPRHSSPPGRHLELRLQVLAQHHPRTTGLARRQFLHHRLAIAQSKRRPQFLPCIALPRQRHSPAGRGCLQAVHRLVTLHVAVHTLRSARGADQSQPQHNGKCLHLAFPCSLCGSSQPNLADRLCKIPRHPWLE